MGLNNKKKNWIIGICFVLFLLLFLLLFISTKNSYQEEKRMKIQKDSIEHVQKIQKYNRKLEIQNDSLITLNHNLKVEKQKNQYLQKDIDTLKKVVFILSKKYNLSQQEIAEMKKREDQKGFWDHLSEAWAALWD